MLLHQGLLNRRVGPGFNENTHCHVVSQQKNKKWNWKDSLNSVSKIKLEILVGFVGIDGGAPSRKGLNLECS